MAKAQEQLSFAEMMQQLAELNAKIAEQGDARVAEIKSELELIATAKGKSIAELLGINIARPAAATAAPRATSSRRSTGDEDPRKTEIKEKFAGQVILNPGTGKDYQVGSRGQFPTWILDQYDDLMAGKLDVMSREDYLNRGNQSEEEQQPAA